MEGLAGGGARSLVSSGPEATRRLGLRLGGCAPAGSCIALSGPLGAGKTLLAKGVAAGLGVTATVNSPTFILMNEYVGRLPLFHIDAYRIDDPDEALAAGLFDERQAGGVTVVEWAERVVPLLPADALRLTLEPTGATERRIAWRPAGGRGAALARVLEPGGGR